MSFLLPSQRLGYAVVESKGFEKDETFIYYTTYITVEGTNVRELYIRIPKPKPYRVPIRISLEVIEDSKIKNLEIEFIPPPTKFTELA